MAYPRRLSWLAIAGWCVIMAACLKRSSDDTARHDALPNDQPAEAAEFWRLKRAPTLDGSVPVERYLTARDRIRSMPRYSTTANQTYASQFIAGDLPPEIAA